MVENLQTHGVELENHRLISVIVPIFNVEKYLRECIDSILTQDYDNFELILVNDGSRDSSLDICKEYLKDSRVLLVTKPNGGLSSARNMGTELVKNTRLRNFIDGAHKEDYHYRDEIPGVYKEEKKFSKTDVDKHFKIVSKNHIECDLVDINEVFLQDLGQNQLIHYLDSDDYLEPNCLKRCNQAFNDHEDIDIIWYQYHVLNEFENKKVYTDVSKMKPIYYKVSKYFSLENTIWQCWWAWRGAFRASTLNGYKLRFKHYIEFEDNDFGCILFYNAKGMLIDNFVGMTYRIRGGSITRINNDRPANIPSYLQKIESNFKNYRDLKVYFKAYSYMMVGHRIAEYATWKNNNESRNKSKNKLQDLEIEWFGIATCDFIKLSYEALEIKRVDPSGIKILLREIYQTRVGKEAKKMFTRYRVNQYVTSKIMHYRPIIKKICILGTYEVAKNMYLKAKENKHNRDIINKEDFLKRLKSMHKL